MPVLGAYAAFVAWSILSVEGAGRELASGLRLALTRPRRMKTVALLGDPHTVSLYGSCLAVIGSHARRLEVMGARARQQMERLINLGPTPEYPVPVVLRLRDGRNVRFIGLDRPRTPEEWTSLKTTVDGVINLDPPEACTSVGALGPASTRLEAIRRDYVETTRDSKGWRGTFQELWAPVDRAMNVRPWPHSGPLQRLQTWWAA
jgi:hypothetical protein